MVNMYLETATRGIRRGTGWYGYVLECFDSRGNAHTVQEFRKTEDVTPNQLILLCFCAALNRMRKQSEIMVYTDQLYLRGNYTSHLPMWQGNGWKTARGETVANVELWKRVAELTRWHQICFARDYQHSYKNWMVSELQKRSSRTA